MAWSTARTLRSKALLIAFSISAMLLILLQLMPSGATDPYSGAIITLLSLTSVTQIQPSCLPADCHKLKLIFKTVSLFGVSHMRPSRDESPVEGMLKHTLEALLRTHATAFAALWEAPERLPNGLWKWDVRHSMWVERQRVQ